MSETIDKLYGGEGIDTSYERERITYRPDIRYSKDKLSMIIRPEVQQSIERSRTFTISQNLSEYDELIHEVDQMLKDIENRGSRSLFDQFKNLLSDKKIKEIISFERNQSGYTQTGDFELYSILYFMKDSMQGRRDFIDNRFRIQITNETELEKIEEAEEVSISEWEQLEARVMEGYRFLAEHDDEDDYAHPSDEDSLVSHIDYITYEEIEKLEREKRRKELFHVSLADTSYIHRNRYFMFLEIVEKAKILTYHSESLINDNLKDLIIGLSELGNLSSAKAHLILQFRKLREKHEGLKGRMMTIDDEKENFGSEKQYLYQQLETKTVEPIKEWLHSQEEEISGALDKFSTYLVDSMKESQGSYESSIADLLNFYQSEANFYEEQIDFLKNKEEIRRFYRIIEDLEEIGEIRNSWVDEYLKANGYVT